MADVIIALFTDPPVVSLSLGSNLEAGDIKEGDDVYFECNVTANPRANKVAWFKDVSLTSAADFVSPFCTILQTLF